MSLRAAVRAYPALLRTGFAAAVAYRAEFLIWMFSTNMPLIMLALWAAVARNGPVGSYSQRGFVAYYLCTLLVRRVRPDKRVLLRLSRPVEARDLQRLGTVVSHTDAQAVLQVSQTELQGAVQRALAQLPVVDMTVEDPPLEEVMRELFQRGAAEGAA